MKKHPGFKAVAKRISAKEGIPMKNAGAILAKSSREASPEAKKKNPALKKVEGAPADEPYANLHARNYGK